jgi:hypothetical protein
MNVRHTYRRIGIVAALAGLSIMARIGFCQIEPSGKNAGLIQFDVISELNLDEGYTNTVVFSRYWVCREYYAVSVVWSEPHGMGVADMKTAVVLSDASAFRMDNEKYAFWVPTNTTYPKPLGERGPFRWGGGMYEGAEMRFAEAEAIARRVYGSDLGTLKDSTLSANRVVDMKVPEAPDGIKRKLARLKAHIRGNRIESMELFNEQQRPLCRMKYEYEKDSNTPSLARLVAELPVRPEKLGVNADLKTGSSRGETTAHIVKEAAHVYHKGGRTCTVIYKDVTIGDKVFRLPIQVEVRASDDKRLLRRARLMHFKRVDLDKSGVWQAARAFADLSDEDWAYRKLAQKYISPKPKLGPMKIDPNDLAFVRRLIAKYPLWEPPRQRPTEAKTPTEQDVGELSPETRMERARMRIEAMKQQAQLQEQMAKTPKPQRKEIDPNDARVMRQLVAHYSRQEPPTLDEEAREDNEPAIHAVHTPSENGRERSDLERKLREILIYHRAPLLAEDRAPDLEPKDCELIRQLQVHYEQLAAQLDRGLGGQLKAMHALTRLDRMLKDYDAFEGHTAQYLQMVQEARLAAAYMVGGHGNLETLVEAGQYEKANRLMRQWVDKSAAENEADAILSFAGWDIGGSKRDPWASVQLLDQFLQRPPLSPVQRYEGLALRAIALHKVEGLVADPETAESEIRKSQAQWILSTAKRAELVKRVESALREALSAWQSLGPAKSGEAKPYSTANMDAFTMNLMGYPEATRLQETSARLDQIVRQRFGQKGTSPRPREARRSAPTR